jgi:carbohydrate-selective porin OprB
VTPRNIDVKHGWYLGTGDHRNTGVLIPFEWQRVDPFSKRLPGLIKVGAFYSNLRLPDVVNDVNGNIRQVTGLAAVTRRDHTGIFANLRQQLALPKANGAHAVNIFFNGTWVSRGTPQRPPPGSPG